MCEAWSMKPYSKDLRIKVLEAVDRGMPREEVAEVFGVSVPSIKRWIKRRTQTGDVEPKPIPGPPARKREALDRDLPEQAKLNPDLTLDEHCELFEDLHGVKVSNATMSRAFTRLKLPLKKSALQRPNATNRSEHAGASR
jgi:transposase